MASLNAIAERIAYSLNDPFNYYLKESIKFTVKHWRATLLRNDIERNGVSKIYTQSMFADLIKVDKAEHSKLKLYENILKTTLKIPVPLRFKADSDFLYVGELGGGNPFVYRENFELPYTKYNKYTNNVISYNYTDGFIYVSKNCRIKSILIQTIFENPAEIYNLTENSDCFDPDNYEFPIGLDQLSYIVEGIIKSEIRLINPSDEQIKIDNNETNTTKVA